MDGCWLERCWIMQSCVHGLAKSVNVFGKNARIFTIYDLEIWRASGSRKTAGGCKTVWPARRAAPKGRNSAKTTEFSKPVNGSRFFLGRMYSYQAHFTFFLPFVLFLLDSTSLKNLQYVHASKNS